MSQLVKERELVVSLLRIIPNHYLQHIIIIIFRSSTTNPIFLFARIDTVSKKVLQIESNSTIEFKYPFPIWFFVWALRKISLRSSTNKTMDAVHRYILFISPSPFV